MPVSDFIQKETETPVEAITAAVVDDAAATPEEREPSPYDVSIDEFEGPLDLLLDLIRKHRVDIFDQGFERLLGPGQRQQIVQKGLGRAAPGDMLRNQCRLGAGGKIGDPREMRVINPIGAAEREPDPVQADRVVGPKVFEQ